MRLPPLLILLPFLSVAHAAALEAQPSPDAPAASDAAPKIERVDMARVGDTTITVEDFMGFLAKNPQFIDRSKTWEGKAALLRTAIENHLLVLAMRDEGLLDADQDATDEAASVAMQQLAVKHFPLPAKPEEDALRRFYEQNKASFGIPASVRVSQIQIRVDAATSDDEKADARQRAEGALKRLQSGEAFGAVAAELTENPAGKEREGDLGFLPRVEGTWLDNAIKGLPVGEHTGVLASPTGYEILMVTDMRAPIFTPLEQAKHAVADAFATQQQAAKRSEYVKQLAKDYGVSIEMEELKEFFPEGVFP
jgi:parvulin-like peptidyl-prolyl isomerase